MCARGQDGNTESKNYILYDGLLGTWGNLDAEKFRLRTSDTVICGYERQASFKTLQLWQTRHRERFIEVEELECACKASSAKHR